ncbi:MAG: preprotein translocase subunit SecA [Deltaproteobacteria bacterium]|nr:preprotein translocase subunit SecA [Deltaproteobacteria bacterium]
MFDVIKKLFGTSHDRVIRRMKPRVAKINDLEAAMKKLSDEELRAKTFEFREQLDKGATLDDILVPAFATAREAGRRVLGMRHYDVQLIGGMVLHEGKIAEMRTGEGKTLVATLACYLNALEGKGVHVVTVNDYLAKRDAEWMGKLYNSLGLSVGVVVNHQEPLDKLRAYRADITYGQNNEFGFDYLRDNMKFSALEYAQRPLHYAIVDEVDSILIDEARTPLIISGQGERSSDKYRLINELIPRLRNEEHYAVDEKQFSVTLTDDGNEAAERLLNDAGLLAASDGVHRAGTKGNLYDPVNLETLHILQQCLRAHALYKRDVNYMVKDGEVLIIDEFTGRVLKGRRWSDGLHQAVEAKEHVPIKEENRTLATVTFQNLFRQYKKLSGMTGTADTEAAEFGSTYNLDVVIVPTNKQAVRADDEDVVYKTEREKFTAVVDEILEHNGRGVPILVGTTSVEKSAAVSRILQKKGIEHQVLNAKHHENEAYVVAQAGRKGAITVSTNMAGRGTDIILGGNPEMLAKLEWKEQGKEPEFDPEAFEALVKTYAERCEAERAEVREAGGLYIVGTERHESRRIDNQLRGRAGRQGDPGKSKFYLSLEDDLMRIFAGDRVKTLMERMGMPDNEPIIHPWVTRSVENAQKKVEERNFDIRKNLLEYDDVMSSQRQTVYRLRQELLTGRYVAEETDEEGRPTGEVREIVPSKRLVSTVVPEVTALLGMFCEEPLLGRDAEGNAKAVGREAFESAKLVEVDTLQKEIYSRWGVVVETHRLAKVRSALEVYDELVKSLPQSLAEQRDRGLDLVDRIVGAIVEDSCPANRPPDEWAWTDVFEGIERHFGLVLPDDVAENGDREVLAEELYKLAEKAWLARERELGLELSLRIYRHIYLEELDRAWVDHLTDMDHLRDGIGLRGYGQKDPKQEYKKEGYNLFVTMLARVSGGVVAKYMSAKVRGAEQEQQIEADDLQRHVEELARALAQHGGDDEPVKAPNMFAPAPAPVTSEMACPCGSGKRFLECHGAEDA